MAAECDIIKLKAGALTPTDVYGARARTLADLIAADFNTTDAWAISVEGVRSIARSVFPSDWPFADRLRGGELFSLRSSPVVRAWGGPETLLNIGMTAAVRDKLAKTLGLEAANALYCRFVQDYAVQVMRLDEEEFEEILASVTDDTPDHTKMLAACLEYYEAEMDEPFPQDPIEQLQNAARSMASAWTGTSARILREAKGADPDAGLGLIAQQMVLGLGRGESGAGVGQFVSPVTGAVMAHGRYLSQGQGLDALDAGNDASFLGADKRGPSLETIAPEAFEQFRAAAELARKVFRDDMRLEFTVHDGEIFVLDAVPAERNSRAAVAIMVRLVEDGIITKREALLGIDPRSLNEILHPQIDPKATRDVVASGIGASPGAATGRIVFTATAAQASKARNEPCILVRVETAPDDIRGMHSAEGVLTERGGITSHAAVVARGLGLPCVVGASSLDIDARAKTMSVIKTGLMLKEGDIVTLDGKTGEVIKGAPKLVQPDLSGYFDIFMSWTTDYRKLGVRANADTPSDARLARAFGVDGVGLCRTEHMFFEENRLNVMRELIFAETAEGRESALNLLLPMQREDFIELFEIMQGQPVCIRLLDPPLHEFLPRSRDEIRHLAEEMNLSVSKVTSRIEELSEFNPMLGTRGVRLGITVPEIYDMQARAIFEAAAEVQKKTGKLLEPEIMVPLVSANREVEIVRARIEAVVSNVEDATGTTLKFALGVIVETPRAALRARDIAKSVTFLSFGTNDLTQMTYGLSRDDAGRFMRQYVAEKVFPEDPFHTLDIEGVGELMLMAASRGREERPDLTLGLCGEHGGDPVSIAFCYAAGFDYVSCSPFRTPIARLAAAQAQILDNEPAV